jgi:hypothetical protein
MALSLKNYLLFAFLFRQFHAVEEQAPNEAVGISFGSTRGDK